MTEAKLLSLTHVKRSTRSDKRLSGVVALLDPRDEQFPDDREYDGSKKKSRDPVSKRSPDHTDQYDEDRRFQSPAHHDRPEQVVEQIDRQHVRRVQQER